MAMQRIESAVKGRSRPGCASFHLHAVLSFLVTICRKLYPAQFTTAHCRGESRAERQTWKRRTALSQVSRAYSKACSIAVNAAKTAPTRSLHHTSAWSGSRLICAGVPNPSRSHLDVPDRHQVAHQGCQSCIGGVQTCISRDYSAFWIQHTCPVPSHTILSATHTAACSSPHSP